MPKEFCVGALWVVVLVLPFAAVNAKLFGGHVIKEPCEENTNR